MNKKAIWVAGVIVLALVAFLMYRHFSRPTVKNTPAAGQTIIAFGDSLVQGVGASQGYDFVSLVSAEIGRPIVNLGRSGDTTRDALARLDDVLAENPDTVIVLLGGNDYLKRIPKEETFKNLGEIVSRFQEHGAAVLVLGVRGGALYDTYETDFENLANTYQTAYVSNVLDNLFGHKDLMSDEIHPNDAGYRIIAGRVAPVLEEMFK